METPTEVEIGSLNDQSARKGLVLRIIPIAITLVAAGAYYGVIRFALLALGSSTASSTNNELVDAALAVFFVGIGLLLMGVLLGGGFDKPTTAAVDDSAVIIGFESGRRVAYRWEDPHLDLRFLRYVATSREPNPGQWRDILWGTSARIGLPPGFVEEVCKVAEAHNLDVSRTPYTAVRSGGVVTHIARRR